jgi:hypothetical protein
MTRGPLLWVMPKKKQLAPKPTHFEQIPVKVVEKIAVIDSTSSTAGKPQPPPAKPNRQ